VMRNMGSIDVHVHGALVPNQTRIGIST
jgi:hypothetical protein